MEEFKTIPNCNEMYSISTKGRVYSKYYRKYIKSHVVKNNKIHVVRIIDKNGKRRGFSVVRLMALTFLENPNPALYDIAINKNGDHNDLRIENVAWGTSAISTRRKHKRYPSILESMHDNRPVIDTKKMTEDMKLKLIKDYKDGTKVEDLEKIYPIKKSQINNIINKQGIRKVKRCYLAPQYHERKRKLKDSNETDLIKMYQLGYSYRELKDIFGICTTTISRKLYKYSQNRDGNLKTTN
jgi:hypothetical protein